MPVAIDRFQTVVLPFNLVVTPTIVYVRIERLIVALEDFGKVDYVLRFAISGLGQLHVKAVWLATEIVAWYLVSTQNVNGTARDFPVESTYNGNTH